MNLKELTWPVRIYWDLAPSSSGTLHRDICREIVGLKVLFLSLREPSSSLGQACRDILGFLEGKGLAVSLTLTGPAVSPVFPDGFGLTAARVRTLLIEASSLSEVRSLFHDRSLRECGGPMSGICFDVRRDNYQELPQVVSFCLAEGVRDLVFPIQRLTAGGNVFCITGAQREELSAALRGLDYRRLRFTIHDPFLWQAFFPDAPYHEGGCQAANSMLYISPEYGVYPCPAMPVELGDLHQATLREIILSEDRKGLRRALLAPPGECAACGQAATCLGGCRGRALAMTASLERRDPGCTP